MRCKLKHRPTSIRAAIIKGCKVTLVTWLYFSLLTPTGAATESRTRSGELNVSVRHVLLPYVNETMLFRGAVDESPMAGRYSIQARIRPSDPTKGWTLSIRATEPRFASPGALKPCTDLLWKHDDDPGNMYSPVRIQETVIFENPAGGNADIHLDLQSLVGWETSPGSYSLNLALKLRYRE